MVVHQEKVLSFDGGMYQIGERKYRKNSEKHPTILKIRFDHRLNINQSCKLG
jgi:hypothetical protein